MSVSCLSAYKTLTHAGIIDEQLLTFAEFGRMTPVMVSVCRYSTEPKVKN